MRLFIGIQLDKEIKEELAGIRDKVSFAKASWVKPQNIHLTVIFLGNTKEELIGKVENSLGEISGKYMPFEIYLDKLGAFPSERKARVFWAGVTGETGYLEDIEKDIQNTIHDYGFKKEKRPFHPHITLARIRIAEDATDALNINLRKLKMEVKELTLFQSNLSPKGAEYTALKKFQLSA